MTLWKRLKNLWNLSGLEVTTDVYPVKGLYDSLKNNEMGYVVKTKDDLSKLINE